MQLIRYQIAANLYSKGWYESLGIIVSVAVGCLKIVTCILFISFKIVISRKFVLFLNSSSMVNCSEELGH